MTLSDPGAPKLLRSTQTTAALAFSPLIGEFEGNDGEMENRKIMAGPIENDFFVSGNFRIPHNIIRSTIDLEMFPFELETFPNKLETFLNEMKMFPKEMETGF